MSQEYNFTSTLPATGYVNFSRYMPPAYPGMVNGMGQFQCYPCPHNVATYDTWTLTPPATVDASKTYKVTLDGQAIAFTTDAAPTATELMAGLYNQAVTNGQFYQIAEVSLDKGTNVLTLKARSGIAVLTIALNPAADGIVNPITLANTVAPSPTPGIVRLPIPFGRFVGRKTTYYRDPIENVSSATLIDAASGYEILGVTIPDGTTEKVGRFDYAKEGYAFGQVMSVLYDTGTMKGVWVETTDADLAIGDTAYIAVAAGKEGMLTKATSGTVNASAKVKIISAAVPTFGNKYVALITLKA